MYLQLQYFLHHNLMLFSERSYKNQAQMFPVEIFCSLILRNHWTWT